jgi:hypothetical protein
MKIQIYRTGFTFLESPMRFGTCSGNAIVTEAQCIERCTEFLESKPKVVTHVATIRFGNFAFEAEKCPPCGSILVPIKKGTGSNLK